MDFKSGTCLICSKPTPKKSWFYCEKCVDERNKSTLEEQMPKNFTEVLDKAKYGFENENSKKFPLELWIRYYAEQYAQYRVFEVVNVMHSGELSALCVKIDLFHPITCVYNTDGTKNRFIEIEEDGKESNKNRIAIFKQSLENLYSAAAWSRISEMAAKDEADLHNYDNKN